MGGWPSTRACFSGTIMGWVMRSVYLLSCASLLSLYHKMTVGAEVCLSFTNATDMMQAPISHSLRSASKCVAASGMHSWYENSEERYSHKYQQRSNEEQPGFRIAEIRGPPQAVAFGDKHGRVVRIVVKKSSIPVAVIIAVKVGIAITISGCVSFPLSRQEQDEDGSNQEYAYQQD